MSPETIRRLPTEPEEMISALERITLLSMRQLLEKGREIVAGGKDPALSHYYQRMSAAVDAECKTLANLYRIHMKHTPGYMPLKEYPSMGEVRKHLLALVEAEEAPTGDQRSSHT